MYLAHVTFGLNYSEVARAFDATAQPAAHACQLIEERRDDPAVDAVLGSLEMSAARCAASSALRCSHERPHLKERTLASNAGIDPLRAQHLELGRRQIRDETGFSDVTVDEAESPLAWLARRKGRDGRRADRAGAVARRRAVARGVHARASDAAHHLELERLGRHRPARRFARDVHRDGDRRASAGAGGARSGGPGVFRTSRRRLLLSQAAGEVERERSWPLRSAKSCCSSASIGRPGTMACRVEAQGKGRAAIRTWLADGAEFVLGVGDGS